ncbi:MAG: hypothetical protein WBX25_35660 [Rhodomicrobium sp.]
MSDWVDQEIRKYAIRGQIIRYEHGEICSLTPFDRSGNLGEPKLTTCDGTKAWLEKTPVLYAESEVPANIKRLDIRGRDDAGRDRERLTQGSDGTWRLGT